MALAAGASRADADALARGELDGSLRVRLPPSFTPNTGPKRMPSPIQGCGCAFLRRTGRRRPRPWSYRCAVPCGQSHWKHLGLPRYDRASSGTLGKRETLTPAQGGRPSSPSRPVARPPSWRALRASVSGRRSAGLCRGRPGHTQARGRVHAGGTQIALLHAAVAAEARHAEGAGYGVADGIRDTARGVHRTAWVAAISEDRPGGGRPCRHGASSQCMQAMERYRIRAPGESAGFDGEDLPLGRGHAADLENVLIHAGDGACYGADAMVEVEAKGVATSAPPCIGVSCSLNFRTVQSGLVAGETGDGVEIIALEQRADVGVRLPGYMCTSPGADDLRRLARTVMAPVGVVSSMASPCAMPSAAASVGFRAAPGRGRRLRTQGRRNSPSGRTWETGAGAEHEGVVLGPLGGGHRTVRRGGVERKTVDTGESGCFSQDQTRRNSILPLGVGKPELSYFL